MKAYNEFQVAQLTRLIEVTRTNLSRPQRQKVSVQDMLGAVWGPTMHVGTAVCSRLCMA